MLAINETKIQNDDKNNDMLNEAVIEENDEDEMKKTYNEITGYNDDAKRARNWIFTLNNYTEADLIYMSTIYETHKDHIVTLFFGKEKAPTTGTHHLQGFIVFNVLKSFTILKKLFPKCYLAKMKSTIEKNYDYCSKGFQITVYGEIPISHAEKKIKVAKQNKINGQKSIGKDNWSLLDDDIKQGLTEKELLIKYPDLSGMYTQGFKYHYEKLRPKYVYDMLKSNNYSDYYSYQKQTMEYLKGPVHQRQILWIWDKDGDTGKSDFTKYLCTNNEYNVIRLSNCKTADAAYAWEGQNIIFDFARTKSDSINYDAMEQLKNGHIFSTKFQCVDKVYPRPHIIVFANWEPNIESMSKGRFDIREINNETKSFVQTAILPPTTKRNV